MYPIRLNLLSPSKRKFLERLVLSEFVKTLIETFIIFLALVGILLLGGDYILRQHFNSLAANLASISNQQVNKNRELKDINFILDQTEKLQKAYSPWTETIAHLNTLVPPGVTLQQLILDTPKKEYTFAGKADTRDDLLLFKKNLETDSLIASVDFPLSQFTDKTNVSFSITAKIH